MKNHTLRKRTDGTKPFDKVQYETEKHEYYNKFIESKGKSSFLYEFHLPQDKNKKVFLEMILFHFD